MSNLRPGAAPPAAGDFDLIVVGGGIHGACLTLEAARRGLRPLLLERDEFGGATSAQTSRILHGGLRYLQSLDLPRFFASVAERRWFARQFPELVRPLPCLMPLHGNGSRRPFVLRAALALNDALSAARNRDVSVSCQLPRGEVLSASATIERFPGVDPQGLLGGAMWHDLVMPKSERVLREILRWATSCGATTRKNTEVTGLLVTGQKVSGVEAVDRADSSRLRFAAPVVVNCAGPWAGETAATFGSPVPGLFAPALAFNLILNHPPVADVAVAVTSAAGGRTYFLLPWHGQVLAGTYHAPWNGAIGPAAPQEDQIAGMIGDLNASIRGLRLNRSQVSQVLAGLLPARQPGSAETSSRDRIVDHRRSGGPRGLYSVVGVKFTTARRVAERTLRQIYAGRGVSLDILPGAQQRMSRSDGSALDPTPPSTDAASVRVG